MATAKLLLNKSRVTKDGTYPLIFQILHQRQKRLIYTGYRLNEDQFNLSRGKVVKHSDFPITSYSIGKMNGDIAYMRKHIITVINLFESKGAPYTAAQLVGQYYLDQESNKDIFIFSYFDQRIHAKKQLGKVGIMAAYQSTRASVERYWGRIDLRLLDVTVAFVNGYHEFLQMSKVSSNTIAYYMRNFRTIYKYALESSGHNSPKIDPFKNIGTQPCKTIKRALKRETLIQMVNTDFSNRPSCDLARDIFIFSFYARGMALVDIIYLTKKNIEDSVLTYNRRKTGQTLSLMLTEQMEEIITKYVNDSDYIFPFMINDTPEKMYNKYRLILRRVNNGLKELTKELNLDHILTTYVARHTWATQAKECGISIAIISEGLGHTSEKTTAIYLKQFDRGILDQANDIVTNLKNR